MLKLREMVRRCGRGWAIAGAFIGSTAVAFAQESGGASDYDSFLTSMQSQITGALEKIWPVLAAILGIVVGFFIAKLAYKYIKQFASR